MNVDIAKNLADRRRAAGLSQEGLAEKLGVTRQAVSKWERSESSPDTDNLIALAQLYGVSLDELLYAKVGQEDAAVVGAAQAAEGAAGAGSRAAEGLEGVGSRVAEAEEDTAGAGSRAAEGARAIADFAEEAGEAEGAGETHGADFASEGAGGDGVGFANGPAGSADPSRSAGAGLGPAPGPDFDSASNSASNSDSDSSSASGPGSGPGSNSGPDSASSSNFNSASSPGPAPSHAHEADNVRVGFDGIHMEDGRDFVHVSWREGVHVIDGSKGDEIHVGWDGVHVNDKSYSYHNPDWRAEVNRDLGVGMQSDGSRAFLRTWRRFPFPLLVVIAYILIGAFLGKWAEGLMLAFAIPLYYLAGSLIATRRVDRFVMSAYPVGVAAWFCYMAFFLNQPHPAWVMFLTVPLVEWLVATLSRSRRRKRAETQARKNTIEVEGKVE